MTLRDWKGTRINSPKEPYLWGRDFSWERISEEMIELAMESGTFETKEDMITIGKFLEFLKERMKDLV